MNPSEFIDYLKTLSTTDWNTQVTKSWTVKDVVAHMIGWEKNDPPTIRQVWRTKQQPWWETAKNFDDFNAQHVAEYRTWTPEQLLAEWAYWQDQVQRTIDDIGPDRLRAAPELFGWLFEGPHGFTTSRHYQHHLDQIRQAITARTH